MRRSLFTLSLLACLIVATAAPVIAITPDDDPDGSAAAWLVSQYEDHPDTFGLGGNAGDIADLIFALAGAGVGADFADDLLADLESRAPGYTGGGNGAVAKVLLAVLVAGGDGAALETQLRDAAPSGEFDPFAFNQALAILALSATGNGVPTGAVDHLVSLQCGDGSFGWGDCPGDPDTTALAAQALLAAGDADDAIAWLLDAQLNSGAFDNFGPSPNSTGVAAVALRAAGETAAADAAATWVASQQAGCDSADAGAIGDAATVFSVEFATLQGLLAFEAPPYDQLDLTAAAAEVPVVCDTVLEPVVDTAGDDAGDETPVPGTEVDDVDAELAATGSNEAGLVLVAALLVLAGVGLLSIPVREQR